MRILMVSDWEWRGGANRAANRLATGLMTQGHELFRAVAYTDTDDPPWQRLVLRPESAPEVPWEQAPSPGAEAEVRAMLNRWCREIRPQAVTMHNIHGGARSGWSVELARTCLDHAPVTFTMHDMWSFTGRCAYAHECEKHFTACGPDCPTTHEYPFCAPKRVAGEHAKKRDLLLAGPDGLRGVAPSKWLRDIAAASQWKNRPVHAIANGLDLKEYSPGDPEAARRALGLAPDRPVVMAASAGFADPRKGMHLLNEALKLARREITLLTMGDKAGIPDIPGVVHAPLGFVDDRRRKVLAYNAAHMTALPSLAENLPNIAAESLACGTPVCAFDTGGVPEMVVPGQTGELAPIMDDDKATAAALAQAMARLLDRISDRGAESVSRACREFAREHYDLDRQTRRYVELFEEMIEQRRARSGR